MHCIYWLYPVEQFHARLDDTYITGGGAATSSWLCSLYSIFALGAASGENSKSTLYADLVSEEARTNPDLKTSDDYLALAKTLIPAVHDEADIDSIRALAILVSESVIGFGRDQTNGEYRVWRFSHSSSELPLTSTWERVCK